MKASCKFYCRAIFLTFAVVILSTRPRIVQTTDNAISSTLPPANGGEEPAKQEEKQEEKPYVDAIQVPIYKSNLTKEMRDSYDYWIKYKNSFNSEEGQLAKMTKYFQPELPTYYMTIYKSGWPFYALAGIVCFCFLAYLVLRFGFNQFLGPKAHITVWFGYATWSLLITGFIGASVFYSLTLTHSSKIHTNVDVSSQFIINQSQVMGDLIANLTENEKLIKENNYATDDPSYVPTVFKLEEISSETLEFKDRFIAFSNELYRMESSKWSYEIAFIVLLPVLTIAGLVFFCLNKPKLILLVSIILFALIVPAFVIMGLNTSYFLLTIDFCQNIKNNVLSGMTPSARTGVGYYISCPSKGMQRIINTGLYELGNSFDHLINSLNTTMATKYKEDIGVYKRNNSQFDYFADKYASTDPNIAKGFISLKLTNKLMGGLLALSQCQTATSDFNYLEDHFCYQNIDHLYYMLIYYFIGTIGLILLTMGINKLVVLLNPAYQNLKKGAKLLED